MNAAWSKFPLTVLMLAFALKPAPTAGVDPGGDDVEALIRAGHWKRARALLEPQVKAHPGKAQIACQLARVKMAFQDFDGALPLAQHAVELEDKNSNYHLKLGQVYGELADRASLFAAGSLAVKFRKEVETALGLDPKNLEALDSMMLFKFQAPGLMGGNKDQARALADEISKLNPCEGFLAYAELAELQKKPEEIEVSYLKAVEVDPKNYRAATLLARFYTYNPHARYDRAIKYAQQALQLDPSRIDAYWILARVFALEERWRDLDSNLASSASQVPDDLRPVYEGALALVEIGKELPKAEGYARKYFSQEPEGEEPDVAAAHRLLALVFEKEGRLADARAEIEMALQLRPRFKAAREDQKRMQKK